MDQEERVSERRKADARPVAGRCCAEREGDGGDAHGTRRPAQGSEACQWDEGARGSGVPLGRGGHGCGGLPHRFPPCSVLVSG